MTPLETHDQVRAQGNVALAGTLHLQLLDDFEPPIGSQFTVVEVQDGTISGMFDEISSAALWDVVYTSDTVVITLA